MMMEPESLDDRVLLAGWQRGDRALGNRLFRRHIRGISQFFRTKVPEAAEDLTQATFLALVELDAAPPTMRSALRPGVRARAPQRYPEVPRSGTGAATTARQRSVDESSGVAWQA